MFRQRLMIIGRGRSRTSVTATVAVLFLAVVAMLVAAAPPDPQARNEPAQTIQWSDLNGRVKVQGRLGVLGAAIKLRCTIRPADGEWDSKRDEAKGELAVHAVDDVALADPVVFSSEDVFVMAPTVELDWQKPGEWELRGYETGGFIGVPRHAERRDVQSSGMPFQFRTHFTYSSSRKLD